MAVPASMDELERWPVPVLSNAPVPPAFLLRPAGERESRAYEYRLMREGLRSHRPESFRTEVIRALGELYSPALFEENRSRLESYWALTEQGGTPDPAEAEAVAELTIRLTQAWPRLREMAADNARFSNESGRIAIAMFVVGWEGIDLGFERSDGAMPLRLVDELENVLHAAEEAAANAKVEGVMEPGTAFQMLKVKAFARLFLTESERKNSSSPQSSKPAPNGSTRKRSNKTAGSRSKVAASSSSKTA